MSHGRLWVLAVLIVSLIGCGSRQTRRNAEPETVTGRRAHERPAMTVSSDPPARMGPESEKAPTP